MSASRGERRREERERIRMGVSSDHRDVFPVEQLPDRMPA